MSQTNTTEMTAVQSAATAIAPLSIKDTVLAQFSEAQQVITELAARYQNVVYDVATPKGMRDAIAARADLRDNGRLMLTRAEKRIKGEVNDLKRVMADKVEELVAIVQPVEDAVDGQIKAEEQRKATEKAELARIEGERVAAHQAGLEKLKSYATQAKGQPLEKIERAIEVLAATIIGPEWEEFAGQAEAARLSVVSELQGLAELERQRLENERQAALVAAERAALQKEREELEAARRAQAEPAPAATVAPVESFAPPAAPPVPPSQTAPLPRPEPVEASALPPAVQSAPVASTAPIADTAPTCTLGQINARIALWQINASQLEQLGFAPVATVKGAKLYQESDLPAIYAAMVRHLQSLMAAA